MFMEWKPICTWMLLVGTVLFTTYSYARGIRVSLKSLDAERQKSFDSFDDNIVSEKPKVINYGEELVVNHQSENLQDKLLNYISDDRFVNEHVNHKNEIGNETPDKETAILSMPGAVPDHVDAYLCYALKLPEDDRYIVKYEPKAQMQVAHHMLLYGCGEAYEDGKIWNCGEMKPVCRSGGQSIMYSWAKNAPDLEMPDGVGFHIGGSSGVKYAVLQVHYADVSSFKDGKATDHSGLKITWTKQPKRYRAGIFLLADGWTPIPPHMPKAHIDMGCKYPGDETPLHLFRFRTHAHMLGLVITGYRLRQNKDGGWDWTLIGMGDPQRPQAFYKMFNDVDIRPNDYVVGRCTYNSMSRDKVTYIGATHMDEMCNFYMMYFYDSKKFSAPKRTCLPLAMDKHDMFYTKFPADSDTPLAEIEARSRVAQDNASEKFDFVYKLQKGWPFDGAGDGVLPLTVGQIAGVDFNAKTQQVVVFQRGDRVWDMDTFNEKNELTAKYRVPIDVNTLVYLGKDIGDVIDAKGANLFYLPHGITIDREGNHWFTDVGSHQVYKFSSNLELLLTKGVKFEPGSDRDHFCKPTDVAVLTNGDFFVSDGYCNNRVVKFDKEGKFLQEFPIKDGLVVHSLALDEAGNRLFVVDREHGRVVVVDPQSGATVKVISSSFGSAVYAIAFSPRDGGQLHVVNGAAMDGFTYDVDQDKIVSRWKLGGELGLPHDLAVSDDDKSLYVAQMNPSRIWKFQRSTANDL